MPAATSASDGPTARRSACRARSPAGASSCVPSPCRARRPSARGRAAGRHRPPPAALHLELRHALRAVEPPPRPSRRRRAGAALGRHVVRHRRRPHRRRVEEAPAGTRTAARELGREQALDEDEEPRGGGRGAGRAACSSTSSAAAPPPPLPTPRRPPPPCPCPCPCPRPLLLAWRTALGLIGRGRAPRPAAGAAAATALSECAWRIFATAATSAAAGVDHLRSRACAARGQATLARPPSAQKQSTGRRLWRRARPRSRAAASPHGPTGRCANGTFGASGAAPPRRIARRPCAPGWPATPSTSSLLSTPWARIRSE